MSCEYHNGALCVDGVALEAIAAEHGTPLFVYSRRDFEARWRAYDSAFGSRSHRVCYAVKANDNLSILQALHELGAGFDIVSGGELERVRAIGAPASAVVFSGVGKTVAEIELALAAGVECINLESVDELLRVEAAAGRSGHRARVAVRVNPDVDPQTHPYISTGLKTNKFGVPIADAVELYARIAAMGTVDAVGIACHIGSQLTTITPVLDAVREVVGVAQELAGRGIRLEHIDVGGGLGITYEDETPPSPSTLVGELLRLVPEHYTVVMEPGRSVIGPAGLLLTRVEYLKAAPAKNFIIVDAAMNDLLRPALYTANHRVQACREAPDRKPFRGDIVGPVCESGDWLARDRELAVAPGDLIAIRDTGAYGSVMASNYNSRPRPAEVLVEGETCRLIRQRQSLAAMLADERAHLIGT